MRQPLTLVVLNYLAQIATSTRFHPRDLNAPLAECYDYIIVGGGVSGLVVANRLTEDPDVTVLVLEAGDLDQGEDIILNPIERGQGLGSKYDWNLWTAPQKYLDGAPRPYDIGRGVGGGSLINGMCWTRGNSADFDAWVALGNPGWGWHDLLPYFKKSENYTNNVDAEHRRDLHIGPQMSTYGKSGYVQVSYPRYFYKQAQLFLDGLRELGIPTLTDPNNGTTTGGMLILNNLSPDAQRRFSARQAYFDRFIDSRSNFHLATGQHAVRLLTNAPNIITSPNLSKGLKINGVEFVSDGSMVSRNVSCNREVILAAGTVHTSQILELSGIGQPEILNKYEIPVVLNLPGVGNNFQDHPYVGVIYYYNNASYFNINKMYYDAELYAELEQQYRINRTGPWTSGAINTVAFPSLHSISKNWTNMVADAASQPFMKHIIPGLHPTILAGYRAQKSILADFLRKDDVSAYEILNDNVGLMSVATMHPFSRGSVHIQSRNPFIQPLIDPRYCSNPLDCQILSEALKFNNMLINTTAMRVLQPTGYFPFLPNATYETLLPAIFSGLRTEFHGTGATSMMPLKLGGVVDTHLRVYGTKNLRIVDAGIMPMVPASHLQAPVYAIAEKAADIIKEDNEDVAPKGCGTRWPSVATDTVNTDGPEKMNLSSSFPTPRNITSPTSASALPRLPKASTFAELLNLTEWSMLNYTRKHQTGSSISRLQFAVGGAQTQKATSVRSDAILNAASIFFDSPSAPLITSSPAADEGTSGSADIQSIMLTTLRK